MLYAENNMRPSIIETIASQDAQAWGSRLLQAPHHLHQNPLFSDDSLAALIDAIPQTKSPINTMASGKHDVKSWAYCDRTGLTGHQVLEAIKHGRLWINMQKLEEVDDRFKNLLDQIYDELHNAVPGFAPFRKSIGLLISSPGAQVFYHADVPGQSLWQIRGKKRIYIYEPVAPYLKPVELENVIRGITEEEISYEPSFDASATPVDLEPGTFLHWPLNGPHRVENADCMNVSITTEHWTPEIRRHFAMNYGNGVLRRELGWEPKSRAISGPAFWAKVAITAGWRLAGLQGKTAFKREMTMRVDPTALGGCREIQPSPAT